MKNILVLMDFSNASYLALRYAITLAKSIDCGIQLFHVADPNDIVQSDNQAAAIREINSRKEIIESRLSAIVEIIEAEKIDSTYDYSIGSITGELKVYIQANSSELIIIGSHSNSKLGEITQYLVNHYNGALFLISKETEFAANSKTSVACNLKTVIEADLTIAFDLAKVSKSPITIFNNGASAEPHREIENPSVWKSYYEPNRKVNFIYCKSDSTTDGIIEHIDQEKPDVICIGRGKKNNTLFNWIFPTSSIASQVIGRTTTTVLLLPNAKD
ncbi:MAG: universal stress protein [Flavobacteriales bacterium]|nr:universal stress protein [Flavobacteriales bacterium]